MAVTLLCLRFSVQYPILFSCYAIGTEMNIFRRFLSLYCTFCNTHRYLPLHPPFLMNRVLKSQNFQTGIQENWFADDCSSVWISCKFCLISSCIHLKKLMGPGVPWQGTQNADGWAIAPAFTTLLMGKNVAVMLLITSPQSHPPCPGSHRLWPRIKS